MENLWSVTIVAIIAPAIMAIILHLLRRSDRKADWARQDEVAERVRVVAEEVKAAHTVVTQKLDTIQLQTDGNLSRVQTDLKIALEKITSLQALVAEMQAGKPV